MTSAYFADLDGTTIFSRRHIDGSDRDFTGLVVVESLRGEALSYMTFEAVAALQRIAQDVTFVPTTTRDQTQFERVAIPGIRSEYAIVANGGRILVDGVEDEDWAAETKTLISEAMPLPVALSEVRQAADGEPWVHLVRSCADLFLYVVAKADALVPAAFADKILRMAEDWGYSVSVQGRSTYLIPNGMTKERGAAEVARRLGSSQTFASGDSLLDVGLMQFADHSIRPNHGELDGLGLELGVTARSGVAAGEDILRFVSDRISRAKGESRHRAGTSNDQPLRLVRPQYPRAVRH